MKVEFMAAASLTVAEGVLEEDVDGKQNVAVCNRA